MKISDQLIFFHENFINFALFFKECHTLKRQRALLVVVGRMPFSAGMNSVRSFGEFEFGF